MSIALTVFTRDFARGMAVAERIEAGITHLNDQTVHDEPQVPFGGVKGSDGAGSGVRQLLRNSPN